MTIYAIFIVLVFMKTELLLVTLYATVMLSLIYTEDMIQ